MIIQYYTGAANIVKVEIRGKEVFIYDSNLVKDGIEVQQLLARDREKLMKWKMRIKKLTEKQIAEELRKDLRTQNGLLLSSEEVKNE